MLFGCLLRLMSKWDQRLKPSFYSSCLVHSFYMENTPTEYNCCEENMCQLQGKVIDVNKGGTRRGGEFCLPPLSLLKSAASHKAKWGALGCSKATTRPSDTLMLFLSFLNREHSFTLRRIYPPPLLRLKIFLQT